MAQRNMDRMRELTEIASISRTGGSTGGRYGRTPDFTAPHSKSTRPRSDRGQTFHFKHKVVSKRNDISDSNTTQTTSSAHQSYIERPSATEAVDEKASDVVLEQRRAGPNEDLVAAGYAYPERSREQGRSSFGTIGETKSERRKFWDDVEHHEPRKSRVQSRIIAELPHEMTPEDRLSAAVEFCQVFEDRQLPYWASIHKPGKRNDAKNFHLHVTYFDRPSGKAPDGIWSHARTEIRRKKSRHRVVTRPDLSIKHPDTRKRDWPKTLRRNYADTLNYFLAMNGHEKRYDPRPYRESGINKEPTEHLGNKVSALESMGLDTVPGKRNARREIRWKIACAEEPWIQRFEELVSPESPLSEVPKEEKDSLIGIASSGITHARKSASLDITSDLLCARLGKRVDFLGEEIQRLTSKEDVSDMARTGLAISALSSEAGLLLEAEPELLEASRKARNEKERHDKMSANLMKTFDKKRRILDPYALFDDDFHGTKDDILQPTEEAAEDIFTGAELQRIEEMFRKVDDEKTDLSSRDGSPTDVDRLEDTVTRISDSTQQDSKGNAAGPHDRDAPAEARDSFPEAMPIEATEDREKIRQLDERLLQMNNLELRQKAVATRDASDLTHGAESHPSYTRGWYVLQHEAKRRGLDIDTGKHDPDLATDPERAKVHRDQNPCPIRVVRKIISRQMVR